MKLTKDTWHYNFWKFIFMEKWYNKEPPNNLCNYFWLLLLGIFTLPLTWMGALRGAITKKREGYWKNIFITLGIYGMLFLIVVTGIGIYQNFQAFLILGAIIIGIIIITLGGKWLLFGYFPKTKTAHNVKETAFVISEGIKSFKENNCPLIEWEESKHEK